MKHLSVDQDALAALCHRWKIGELAVFGSVLRPDFGADSDIDLLIRFAPDAPWDLFDLVNLREELESLFGRSVDLVEEQALVDPYRRREILNRRQVFYAA